MRVGGKEAGMHHEQDAGEEGRKYHGVMRRETVAKTVKDNNINNKKHT